MTQSARQFGMALGAMTLSVVLVLGSLVLSLVEGGAGLALMTQPGLNATPALVPSQTPSPTPVLLPGEPTYTPQPAPTNTLIVTPTPSCTYPPGWVQLSIPVGVTLENLAAQYGVSENNLMQANCLDTNQVRDGMIIYVPAQAPTEAAPTQQVARPTTVTIKCSVPRNWVIYTVQPGDTLYQLSRTYGVTVRQLQEANCLANPSDITAGQKLYVPYLIPTATVTATSTPTLTRTPPPTATFTATVTLTNTPIATGKPSHTPRPSATATPTATPTPTPTATATPSPTPTDTATPTPDPTDTPTATPSPTTQTVP